MKTADAPWFFVPMETAGTPWFFVPVKTLGGSVPPSLKCGLDRKKYADFFQAVSACSCVGAVLHQGGFHASTGYGCVGVTLQKGTAVWVSRFNRVRLCSCHASTGYGCVGVTLQQGTAVWV